MSAAWVDVRVAIKGLIRSPRFSLAAVAALALGIGPNTAIFSIVHATLLAPLPYPQPDELVIVWSMTGDSRARTSAADYLDWKSQATSFAYLEPFWARQFNLATSDAPERVRARQVSIDGHRMFGEGVWLGRDFGPGDDEPGRNQVVLLSHRLWRERFGGDPAIVGRDIRMDGNAYTVIGILRPGPRDRLPADLWIPLSLIPQERENRQFRPLLVTGRLKTGVTIQQAQAEMDLIAAGLARRFPDANAGRTVSVQALQNNFLATDTVTTLWLLLAAVTCVVLIASVNVANLLLARGAAREHETALRTLLGASRARIAGMVMTESLAIAVVGGACGALASAWILKGILGLLPAGTLPSEADPRLSLPVLLFTLCATMLSGLLCGAAQAWQGARLDAHDALKQAGRGATGRGRRRLHRSLVVAEVALAVTLLAGAGLTILSFWNRMRVDLGVRADGVLTFSLPVNDGRLAPGAETDAFYRQVVEGLEGVPGVTHAALSAPGLPLSSGFSREFSVVGGLEDTSAPRRETSVRIVSPGYFDTFGVRVVRGRALTGADLHSTQRVAVVNERFATLFLGGQEPVGERVVMTELVPRGAGLGPGAAAPGVPVEWHIVGVFRDVSNAERFGDARAPEIYVPFAQNPWPTTTVAVRSATDRPEALRRGVAAAIQAIQQDLPLTEVRTLAQIVGDRLAPDRLNVALYGGLAALALVLSVLGIYAVMAYSVTQRAPEIGLRMALGARPAQVLLEVMREGLLLAGTGLVAGLFGAYALGRAMEATLYSTSALSLIVLLPLGVVLLAAATAACYVPARRAAAVDPMIALRQA